MRRAREADGGDGRRAAVPAEAGRGAPTVDGRARQPTALDGFEDAVLAIQERLGDGRLSGRGAAVPGAADLRERWCGTTGTGGATRRWCGI